MGQLEIAELKPSVNLREMKTLVHTEIRTLVFVTVIFILTKRWKQSKCLSTDKSRSGISTQWKTMQQF